MNKYFREPVNSITHFSGALFSLIGLVSLIIINVLYSIPTVTSIISIIVYGLSLFLLYSASGIFHMVIGSKALIRKFQKLDHAMIYVLIAGTYTPFCLLSLSGELRVIFTITIWSIALIGIYTSIFFTKLPSLVSALIYILMGWIAIFVIIPLYHSLSGMGVFWLILGGVLYTVGGIVYGLKKPNISPKFGSHELFHIFVLLGSICHYWAILKYVIL
ncbi:MAG: channel protein hemolysin family [Haloplasmataceae bacterium]|jgi:hemolysin III|nr:channel protein hemolysin family [Haloplasmataceae bacterium]